VLLRHRTTQAECFDAPGRDLDEVRNDYRWLARVNRLTRHATPFQHFIPSALGPERARSLSLLDVGAGDGRLGETLEAWAARRGWSWSVTNLDANPHCRRICRRPVVIGSAMQLPFPDRAFDVVLASTMTHHLTDEETVVHFREAARVAGRLVVITDLQRNPLFAAAIWCALFALRAPRHFRTDGVLSVRRGWRRSEWLDLARRAGLPDAEVRAFWGMQIILRWLRPD
jgi:2-polyprenyl-3-methyl-5-hydroxy-6-metoxy-1,4-benzoquinol methylase